MAAPGGRAEASVKDLGCLEGPILLFGGAYSNLQALQAVLAAAGERGIPAERVVHTGDVVAYCAQPRETTELLRSSGVRCLMGNCEESIGVGKTDCGCGFPEDSKCNEYSVNWYSHATKELADHPHLRDWMGHLPRRIEFVAGGRRLAVVHGSPRNISEFVWPSASDAALAEMFDALPANIDAVISGHSGIPFARLLPSGSAKGPRLWLNAGVIGMPANDGTTRGWFSVLSPQADGSLAVTIHALHYDSRGAAEAIYARPQLVRGYADSLISGIWPSHDVLPLQEQMATGVELKECSLVWPPQAGKSSSRAAPAEFSRTARCPPWVLTLTLASAAAVLLSVAWSQRARGKRIAG